MPFYYDVSVSQTTNATVNTENTAARLLTVANQPICRIVGVYVAGRMAAAGGAQIRLKTMATAGTAGTAYTPGVRRPTAPAAQTTVFTAHTVGATPTTRIVVSSSIAGGFGAWVALNDDHALNLLANGGANGNVELINISSVASSLIEWTLEFSE